MSSSRKSDNNIVPEKPANNEVKTFAEHRWREGGAADKATMDLTPWLFTPKCAEATF